MFLGVLFVRIKCVSNERVFFLFFLCYYYLIHNSGKTFVRAGIYEVNNTSVQPVLRRHIVVLFIGVGEKNIM